MLVKAFLVGGVICLIGQLIMDLTSYKVTPGHILVGFVTAGVFLSALGLYQPLVDFAGAGATVPLTGFGHLLAQGAIEEARRTGLGGVFRGAVNAAAGGLTAAVVFGYLAALLFRPKG
ncbi:stage V sporulation protein AE [Desulforamulus hydrothermalis]|uniref:Stage V sporulation protein AEB n=1 Tax=Desulforamulus hydrothermalis Lam5 = DSM 18033 TaxID=1121428 RepID=K8E0I0_9FIRM|nr:stage V sporulation protein AE [Desulforamulus hydrothermalis]CCO08965.1 Stage V sporulation protein AEB [Desulforamulus hydrothermalis Lam5 = DSM 18033]SHG75851.1 stage V sporulation protein AE [Desulforamulus hydrothermalis Lam5 = DSM 18033]